MTNDANEFDKRDHVDSYFSRAHGEALPTTGRFAGVERTEVTGAATQYPRLPAGSPWASQPVPPEEPLRYSIDAMDPIEPQPPTPACEIARPSQATAGPGAVPPALGSALSRIRRPKT